MSRMLKGWAVRIAAGLGLALSVVAGAQAQGEPGPAVGATIPATVSLPDQTGAARDLVGLAGENGSVIVFLRAADWCPFCQRQLIELSGSAAAFEERGYSVVSVSTDTVNELERFANRRDIGFTMLADTDSAVIAQLNVLDPAANRTRRAPGGLPFPVTLVVDPQGVVIDKFYNAPGYGENDGFRVRVSAADVLAGLDGLNAADEAGDAS